MMIRCKSSDQAYAVLDAFLELFNKSRFTFAASGMFGRRGGAYVHGRKVWIVAVRLETKKGYCGNHPGPCKVTGKKHKKNNLLEGLDWVSFDDMLNDALDVVGFNHGTVQTDTCVIRQGAKRRVEYTMQDNEFRNGDWEKVGESTDYTDCIGDGVIFSSGYPEGTPGIIGWLADCVESPYEEA